MKKLFTKLKYHLDNGSDCVLCVIIREDGSSPRGTGSMMLTGSSGLIEGTIGGGAIEKNAIETASGLLGNDGPCVKEYILNPAGGQDLGMVCGGDVSVLFVPIKGYDRKWTDIAAALIDRYEKKESSWLVLDTTVPGAALLRKGGFTITGNIFPEPPLADGCILDGTVFSIPVVPKERAVIFGGGHCGKALVPILTSVGFSVTVMDSREEFASRQMHPLADELICGDYEHIDRYVDVTPEDYCIVMTNGHAFDMIVEKQLLEKTTAYLGVIGSKRKIAAVNAQLIAAGIPEETLSTVHTPIGLSIKAVTPEEIAISITAEIILERALRREAAGEISHSSPMH